MEFIEVTLNSCYSIRTADQDNSAQDSQLRFFEIMLDQADNLRRLVRETMNNLSSLQSGVPLLTVCGARQGVGTTTISYFLAKEFSQLGKRVVLIDANLSNRGLTSKLRARPGDGLREVLSGWKSVAEVLTLIGDGIKLLPGTHLGQNTSELNSSASNLLLAELCSLHSEADLVLIDAGAEMSPWSERFWTAATQILLTTTVQPAAVMDGYAAVKLSPWETIDGKLRLIVNRCCDFNLGIRASHSFTSTCRRFLGMKFLSEAMMLATEEQLPLGAEALSHKSPFRRSLRLLAADLLSQTYVAQGLSRHPSGRQERVESKAGSQSISIISEIHS